MEINGYEITIEEIDGQISVKAERDEETIEEFTLEPVEEGQGEEEGQEDSDSDEVKSFDDFEGGAQEDFEGEEGTEGEEPEGQEEEEEESNESQSAESADALQLESFQSFINKKK